MPPLALRSISFLLDRATRPRRHKVRNDLNFFLRAAIGIWLFVWLAGCVAPPDPGAFADSTRALAKSVGAVGAETHEQLALHESMNDLADDFKVQWSVRDRCMSGAAEYSNALVAIFARSQSSQAAALSRSLQAFAHAVGVGGTEGTGFGVGVGVGVLATTADTVAFIAAQIALVEASRSLEEALTKAQPVIDRLAALIVADTADLERIVQAAAVLARVELTSEFDELLSFSSSIERRRVEIRRVSYADLTVSQADELVRADALAASVASDLAPYKARREAIDTRERDAIGAIAQARTALLAWAEAHRSLAQSVRDHRAPDLDALTEAIAELAVLIARLRDMSH